MQLPTQRDRFQKYNLSLNPEPRTTEKYVSLGYSHLFTNFTFRHFSNLKIEFIFGIGKIATQNYFNALCLDSALVPD